jgi:hypothetical protein
MFLRNMLPPSSELKSKPSKKPAGADDKPKMVAYISLKHRSLSGIHGVTTKKITLLILK